MDRTVNAPGVSTGNKQPRKENFCKSGRRARVDLGAKDAALTDIGTPPWGIIYRLSSSSGVLSLYPALSIRSCNTVPGISAIDPAKASLLMPRSERLCSSVLTSKSTSPTKAR